MKKIPVILIVFCFSSCLTCIECPEISGYVYNAIDKKPVEDAKVRFVSIEDGMVYNDSVYSDRKGHVYFKKEK